MPRAAFVREERAWKKNLSVNTNKTQLPATFDRKFTMPSERAWVRVRQDGRDCLPRGWIGDGGHGSCAESQFDTSKIPSCGVPTLIVDSSYCHRRGERLSVNFFPTHVFEEVWDKLRSQFPRGIVKDNLLPALMR